eukprot:scaffold106_cov380-Prasinococcus_capsulatus_cf.AAC.66
MLLSRVGVSERNWATSGRLVARLGDKGPGLGPMRSWALAREGYTDHCLEHARRRVTRVPGLCHGGKVPPQSRRYVDKDCGAFVQSFSQLDVVALSAAATPSTAPAAPPGAMAPEELALRHLVSPMIPLGATRRVPHS